MVYQYDFVCTYKLMDTPEDQEELYRIQFLQAFDLNKYDEEKIGQIIIELFSKLYLNHDFKTIIKKAFANKELYDIFEKFHIKCSEDLIFTFLFEYAYFDLLHSCIADFLMHGEIHPKHLANMISALQ